MATGRSLLMAVGLAAPLGLGLQTAAPAVAPAAEAASTHSNATSTVQVAKSDPSNQGSVDIHPSSVTENDNGDVSFAVEISNVSPKMDLRLHSPGVNAACDSNTLNGKSATADFNGNDNLAATADSCVAGTYLVEVSEQSTPYQTFYTTLTIQSPSGSVDPTGS